MKIKWLGHAAFLITSDSGTRIITDPYAPNDDLRYGQIDETADIVTISHEHTDHSNIAAVRGKPQVIRGTAEARGIKFRAIRTYHDDAGGRQRGSNTIFCFAVDGVNICHLGDIGHRLRPEQITEMGRVDVLLIPVGGFFTIDVEVASQLCDQLQPGVVMPMHYRNEKVSMPIKGVEEFLRGKSHISRLDSSEVEIKAGELPKTTQIMVLKPAL
jgi:L-ascorbate metabolism protein UlaG (beta-lactamase superfamily)